MTVEERAQEIERLAGMKGEELMAEGMRTYADVAKRLSELVGRSIYTHEMADPQALANEVRSGSVPSLTEVIGKIHKINPDLPVIVVAVDEP